MTYLVEDKIAKFLANLEICSDFGIEEDSDYIVGEDFIIDAADIAFKRDSYETAYGASKYVLKVDGYDFVIKIPYFGINEYTSSVYNEETEEWEELDDPEDEFTAWNIDYCAKEVSVYENAVDANLDFLFAKVWQLGNDMDGNPVYAQEKIHHFGSEFDDGTDGPSADSRKKASTIISKAIHYNRLSESWLASVIEWYGEVAAQALIDFIDEQNVNDLHCGNVGFRDNGAPVLVDFSGFYS